MHDLELTNRAIEWLKIQSKTNKSRPRKFTPKEISNQIDGAYTSLGKVADNVVRELIVSGIEARYQHQGKRKYFELL